MTCLKGLAQSLECCAFFLLKSVENGSSHGEQSHHSDTGGRWRAQGLRSHRRLEVFILRLHSKSSYAITMQSRDGCERGDRRCVLGELTLVGAQ